MRSNGGRGVPAYIINSCLDIMPLVYILQKKYISNKKEMDIPACGSLVIRYAHSFVRNPRLLTRILIQIKKKNYLLFHMVTTRLTNMCSVYICIWVTVHE